MFWFEILMIFLGMIISTIFQDYINNLYLKIKRGLSRLFHKKKPAINEAQTFVIGNRPSDVVVIDGDGYGEFSNKNILFHIAESLPQDLPPDVRELKEKTISEIEAKKANGDPVPWNGKNLSLYKYVVSRSADFEDYQIELFLAESDYYTVYSTIHNLDSTSPSLREKYIDSYNFENNSIYPLPNAIGLCLCVRTKDNKMIFAHRSSDSGFRPGECDVSVVEGINPQYDLKLRTLDLKNACNRAIDEEIGKIEDDKVDISVLGFVFDKKYNQWNFIGDVYIDMTQDEIIRRRNSGTSGKWELVNLDFINFKPKEILRYLSTHKIWDMGLVAVYFSLVHSGSPKKKLDKMIKTYLK